MVLKVMMVLFHKKFSTTLFVSACSGEEGDRSM